MRIAAISETLASLDVVTLRILVWNFFAEPKLTTVATTKRAYPLWKRPHCALGLHGNRFPRYRARVEGLERK